MSKFLLTKPTIIKGDITKQDATVIVNAANKSLLGGGGVDGAIHAAAGPELYRACVALRATPPFVDGLEVGNVVVTPAYDLEADWVIHTVGPQRWDYAPKTPGGPPGYIPAGNQLLYECFSESLKAADRLGAASIAFPAISAGVYAWPLNEVAQDAFLAVNNARLEFVQDIRFVLFDDKTLEAFELAFKQW